MAKKEVSEITETFKKIQQQADEAGKKAAGFDKDLAVKIHRTKEGAQEVVKHIEERQNTQKG